jgi:hypothetical protein
VLRCSRIIVRVIRECLPNAYDLDKSKNEIDKFAINWYNYSIDTIVSIVREERVTHGHFLPMKNMPINFSSLFPDDATGGSSILWSLLIDMSYLAIFVSQHSIMTNDFIRRILYRLRIEHLDRSIYNACSSASLHLLINKWQWISNAILWRIETRNDIIWILFSALHVFAWSIIYSGCVMMDISELSGVKQVWYTTYGRNSSFVAKSKDLRRYMRHMRHPSFTGFLIILWIHPFMT